MRPLLTISTPPGRTPAPAPASHPFYPTYYPLLGPLDPRRARARALKPRPPPPPGGEGGAGPAFGGLTAGGGARARNGRYVNNQRENYSFKFNGIIGPEAKQEEVFERVARGVLNQALAGVNGTIFAYGQTGSGKTFTITGGPERYADRGLIPRTISHVFSELSKRSGEQFQVHISYLEIYNNTGYDLLDPDREIRSLEDLPRVGLLEDDNGSFHMRNLSAHRATNEEEALNFLFLGDTNRTISETPMNMASSRSHCIFTLYIESRKPGEDTVRRAKLNLVDLAGSERVSKTGVNGTTLSEAKFINLSLLSLEQVIIALQERAAGHSRDHIPYRNSMMTAVLKDSLGGNCKTTMIATMNPAHDQIDESISTCRFAQRVAMISNEVSVNEELDPAIVIRRLKKEIRDMKDELKLLRGEEEDRGPLTADELHRLRERIEAWVEDTEPDARLELNGSMMFITAALQQCKALVRQGGGGRAFRPGDGKAPPDPAAASEVEEQVRKLKLQVQQRDNEINILVSMLKRKGANGVNSPRRLLPSNALNSPDGKRPAEGKGKGAAPPGAGQKENEPAQASGGGGAAAAEEDASDVLINTNLLADRNKAFELFRKSYRKNEVIEENKAILKEKYTEAKALGQKVNERKKRISSLKALIEQRRIERAMTQEGAEEVDPEEERAKGAIEKEKAEYKQSFERLRQLKREIEHVQKLLEQSRVRLQKDFEQWLDLMLRQQEKPQSKTAKQAPEGAAKDAYNRPAVPVKAKPALFAPAASMFEGVDEAVRKKAAPLLTGNEEADRDIIKFYTAREQLLKQNGAA